MDDLPKLGFKIAEEVLDRYYTQVGAMASDAPEGPTVRRGRQMRHLSYTKIPCNVHTVPCD